MTMESIAMTRQMLDGDKMIVNMGPSHPTTHGTLRIVLELEGETITKATPEMGYLHRGVEKLAESLSYQQFIPLTDRLNYCSAIMNNVGYAMAVEKLLGIEIPERARALRVLLSELSRVADHIVCVGVNAVDIGAFTAFLYLFKQRLRPVRTGGWSAPPHQLHPHRRPLPGRARKLRAQD
jgi:NADH:ubiquinone oxidoreductase subunit D